MKNTSYFSLQEDAPADKRSLFIWAARARTRTHASHKLLIYLTVFLAHKQET